MKQSRHVPVLPVCLAVALVSLLFFKRQAARGNVSNAPSKDAGEKGEPTKSSSQKSKNGHDCPNGNNQPTPDPADPSTPVTSRVRDMVLAVVFLTSLATAYLLMVQFIGWGFLVSIFSPSVELVVPAVLIVLVYLLSLLKGFPVVTRLRDSLFQWWLKKPQRQVAISGGTLLFAILTFWITSTCTPPKWDQFVLALCEGDRGDYRLAQAKWEELKSRHPVEAQLLEEVLDVFQIRSAHSHAGRDLPTRVPQNIHSLSQDYVTKSPYILAARKFALAEALNLSLTAEPLEQNFDCGRNDRLKKACDLLDDVIASDVQVVPPRLWQAAVGNKANVLLQIVRQHNEAHVSDTPNLKALGELNQTAQLLRRWEKQLPRDIYLSRQVWVLYLNEDLNGALRVCSEWLYLLQSDLELANCAAQAAENDSRPNSWIRNRVAKRFWDDAMKRTAGSQQMATALSYRAYLTGSIHGYTQARESLEGPNAPIEVWHDPDLIAIRLMMKALEPAQRYDVEWVAQRLKEQSEHRSVIGREEQLLRGIVLLKAGDDGFWKAFTGYAGLEMIPNEKSRYRLVREFILKNLRNRSKNIEGDIEKLMEEYASNVETKTMKPNGASEAVVGPSLTQ